MFGNITLVNESYFVYRKDVEEIPSDSGEEQVEINDPVVEIGLSCLQSFANLLRRGKIIDAINTLFGNIFTPKNNSDAFVNLNSALVRATLGAQVGQIVEEGTFLLRSTNLQTLVEIRHISHRSISEAAYKKNRQIPVLLSGGIELLPLKVNGEKVLMGQIVPTCIKHLRNFPQSKLNHLANIYVCKIGGNCSIVRSGAVNTTNKARELIQVVKFLNQRDNDEVARPLRIGTQQLNSHFNEHELIVNQHQALLSVREESIKIVHWNLQFNRIVSITQQVKKIPVIGKTLERIFLSGEILSKKQNIEALAQCFMWICEDMELKHEMKKELNVCLDLISKNLSNEKNLEFCRNKTRKVLKKIYHSFLFKNADIRIRIFCKLVAQQLDLKGHIPISRGAEIMLVQMLNDLLGVICTINCKSGLDRTSSVHAVKLAMQTLRLLDDSLFDFITTWDGVTKAMNIMVRENGWEAFIESLNNKPSWLLVNKFRQLVLRNLLNHGLPITAFSTGLLGLRWHKGLAENLQPLNFIPPIVDVEGQFVEIINYNRDGSPARLTDNGHYLLTQYSKYRDA